MQMDHTLHTVENGAVSVYDNIVPVVEELLPELQEIVWWVLLQIGGNVPGKVPCSVTEDNL